MTISQRRDRLRQRLAAAELDAMLVSDLVNVRYLSGFTGSNAALLIRADDETPVLATDGRYRTQAAQQAPDAEIVIERACGPHLAGRAAADGVRRLGFESHVVTVDGFAALAQGGRRRRRTGPRRRDGRGAARGQGRGRDRAAAAGLRGRRRGAERPGRARRPAARAAPRRRWAANSRR